MDSVAGVKGDDPGDAATGADTRDLGVRIGRNVRQIADEGGNGDEREVAKWPQKILHVIAEHEEEIDVADKMKNAGMKEERCQKREAARAHCLRWDQSKTRYNFMKLRERQCACADD